MCPSRKREKEVDLVELVVVLLGDHPPHHHLQSSSLSGPLVPLFRALSGRLEGITPPTTTWFGGWGLRFGVWGLGSGV